MHVPEPWVFDPAFDPTRRSRLESSEAIGSICSRVTDEASNIRCDVEAGYQPSLSGCHRPVFVFQVERETFDTFFNSPHGLRAQYLTSPNLGEFWTHWVVELLSEKLLAAFARANTVHEMVEADVKTSLAAASAKIWIDEDAFPFGAPSSDLAIPLWTAAALVGVEKAKWGLCAPTGTLLQVKGAFLDPYGNEVVPADKVCRKYQIAAYGFS